MGQKGMSFINELSVAETIESVVKVGNVRL